MMDRNYPTTPSFADPLAPAAAQPAASWAYERGASSLKPRHCFVCAMALFLPTEGKRVVKYCKDIATRPAVT